MVEMNRDCFHGTADLSLSYDIRTGLHHQNRILGIEIYKSVEVLVIYRLVGLLDQLRDGMLTHSFAPGASTCVSRSGDNGISYLECAMAESFQALVVEDTDGKPRATFKSLTRDDLPAHDVLVQVEYSTLNYKDGLAVSGRQKIVRKPPLIAGIDLAGTVVESRSSDFRPGERVVVNGWGLSETQSGGYTRYQRVKPEWLIRIPERFTTKQAMAIGTAGYTADLCMDGIEKWGIRNGPVLVTGAAGGVGSIV